MTAKQIIERLLRLMTMRSAMLQTEWDSINNKYENALTRSFGSLETAKSQAFKSNYEIGYVTAKERDMLTSMLSSKMPKRERDDRAVTPAIPGTEDWGVTTQRRGW
jgi:hypothetical protein